MNTICYQLSEGAFITAVDWPGLTAAQQDREPSLQYWLVIEKAQHLLQGPALAHLDADGLHAWPGRQSTGRRNATAGVDGDAGADRSPLAEAESGGYRLMDTARLRKHYERGFEDVLVVDTRQEWEFRTGHIPGAINFSMEPTWWSRLRSRAALEKAMGPDRNRVLVFY